MHAYFLRKGRVDVPIRLEVDSIRDGRSFCTRRVVASQAGVPILNLSASFHGVEAGLDHGPQMPTAPDPETLVSQQVLSRRLMDKLPAGGAARIAAPAPFEIRPVVPHDPANPVVGPATRQTWYRTSEALPDEPALHRRLLAWAADSHFLTTVTQPHGVSWLTPGISVASLDHAMWFHRPFRVDQWLLYEVSGPTLCGSRGLVQGRFFTPNGVLVASTAQEGLIRDSR
jgi:acyl-CoA thioesterase-2